MKFTRASLPMYDFYGAKAANDVIFSHILRYIEWWNDSNLCSDLREVDRALIRNILREGEKNGLHHVMDSYEDEVYNDSALFTQACGQHFVEAESPIFAEFEVIGQATYTESARAGCRPGEYSSYIVTRSDVDAMFGMDAIHTAHGKEALPLLAPEVANLCGLVGQRLTINSFDSFSGFRGICAAFAIRESLRGPDAQDDRDDENIFFHPEIVCTGAHIFSVDALISGKADVASIDVTSWRIFENAGHPGLDTLCVRGKIGNAPSPPLLVHKELLKGHPAVVAVLQLAFLYTFSGATGSAEDTNLPPTTAEERRQLEEALHVAGISGFEVTNTSAYQDAFKRATQVPDGWTACNPVRAEARSKAWTEASRERDYMALVDLSDYVFPLSCREVGPAPLTAAVAAAPRGTTGSDCVDAAVWISRGLILCFGFNHYAAVDCFENALQLDPKWGLAHWGIAYALGENYNKKRAPDPAEMARALKHAKRAAQWASDLVSSGRVSSSAKEILLAESIASRCCEASVFSGDASQNRHVAALSDNYVTIMRRAAEAHPYDADIQALYAESLMNIDPWKLWEIDESTSRHRADVDEICRVLEGALSRCPRHPGLTHFYVHAMELSGEPHLRKALGAAMMMRSQWPALGHLVHMPTHLDVQVGRYSRAVFDNEMAVVVDGIYEEFRTALCPPSSSSSSVIIAVDTETRAATKHESCSTESHASAGDEEEKDEVEEKEQQQQRYSRLGGGTYEKFECYYYGYTLHLHHFIQWSACLLGDEAKAMKHSRLIANEMPQGQLAQFGDDLEAYLQNQWHVMVRFGRWNDIIAADFPVADVKQPGNMSVTTCSSLYAKSVAYAATGDLEQAAVHHKLLVEAVARVPAERHQHNVSARDIMTVALAMSRGEMAYRAGDYEVAFESLREAVNLEDALPYDEPPGWMVSTRHALGALLVERASRMALDTLDDRKTAEIHLVEAEAVFRRDLMTFPDNVWAVSGLLNTLKCRQAIQYAAGTGTGATASTSKCCGISAPPGEARLQQILDTALATPYLSTTLKAQLLKGHACLCAGRPVVV